MGFFRFEKMSHNFYYNNYYTIHTKFRALLRALYKKLDRWFRSRDVKLLAVLALALMSIVVWLQMALPSNVPVSAKPKPRLFVLISAVYNRRSRLYDDNKFVLLINAPVGGAIEGTTFVATSTNGTDRWQQNFALIRAAPTNIVCAWTTYMAVFDSVVHPKLLEIGYGSVGVPVKFQQQYLKKSVEVATCVSPLFLAEHWQLVVLAVEIYRFYGIQLQVVYLMSAIEGIYEILRAYESRGILQLEPWPSIETKGHRLDANLELDWRNQATAHTDCLLKYGYSAEFLIVGDLDDILVPDHNSYYEEFVQNDYTYKRNAVALLYHRFTVDIIASRSPSKFSLFDALTSAKVAFYEPDDAKYVVNTSRAEALWIHWPINIRPNTSSRSVPSTDGRMLHFRNWHFLDDNNNDGNTAYKNRKLNNDKLWRSVALNESFISTGTARKICRKFQTDIFARHFATFRKMPMKMAYSALIAKCYNRIFYRNDKQATECPGPHRCRIRPIRGINCAIAKRPFVRQKLASDIFFYTSSSKGAFYISKTGCTL